MPLVAACEALYICWYECLDSVSTRMRAGAHGFLITKEESV